MKLMKQTTHKKPNMSQWAVPVPNAVWGVFVFTGSWLACSPPPPQITDSSVALSKRVGILMPCKEMITHQVSGVSRGAVTLSCDVITPGSVVTFTLEVTLLAIGSRWAGVCTNSSLKCQYKYIKYAEKEKEEKISAGNVTGLHWHYWHGRPGENSGRKQQNMDNESMIDVWSPPPISRGHAVILGVSVMRNIVAKYIIMIYYCSSMHYTHFASREFEFSNFFFM